MHLRGRAADAGGCLLSDTIIISERHSSRARWDTAGYDMLAVTLLLQRCRLIGPKGKEVANLKKGTEGQQQAWGTASHRKRRLASPVLCMGHTGKLYVRGLQSKLLTSRRNTCRANKSSHFPECKIESMPQVWWCRPTLTELGRCRQQGQEFKAGLGYLASLRPT